VFIELTPLIARQALKGLALYRERFTPNPTAPETFDKTSLLQQKFSTDLAGLGFNSLKSWRSALVTLDLTYAAITDSIGLDTSSLGYSPSANNVRISNRKIVAELLQNEFERALLEDLQHLTNEAVLCAGCSSRH